jgi:serine/threonine protein phosphatase PrpC
MRSRVLDRLPVAWRALCLFRMEENMRIQSAASSHIGRRNNNEDAYCVEPAIGLCAVADGMGGYEGGEVASRVTIESVRDFAKRNASDDDVTWPFATDKSLRLDENQAMIAVRLAHREVVRRQTGLLSQMGSTLAALQLHGDHVVLSHIGDSRIYRLRGRVLALLTEDHSVLNELRRAGGEAVARADSPYGHMVTRAIGMASDPCPDVRREPVEIGDTFLLCTDGLSEMVDEAELATMLASPSIEAACAALIDRAYAAGGRDNITAVIARVSAE